jgi:hypothetical protein
MRAPEMRNVNGPRLTRLLLGRIKWLVPLGLWLLIGFFYLAAFFAEHTPFEAAVLVFLGLNVFAGLLEATSVPAAVPVLLFDDVVHVTLGALAVQLATRTAGMTAVQAAALVGVLAWLSGGLKLLSRRAPPGPIYCRAFVGMTSSRVLPSVAWITLAGILAGILYSLANHCWMGMGGKLGTIAFAGAAITVALAPVAGIDHPNLAIASVDPPLQLAVIAVAIVSVPLTYWLSEHGNSEALE